MQRSKLVLLSAALAGVLGAEVSVPVLAHHSFPATYVVDQAVTIEGTVSQFLFRNPHSFVHVVTLDKSGKTVTWLGAIGALARSPQTSNRLTEQDCRRLDDAAARSAGRERALL
jgi:hypothetical protein